MCKKQKHVSSSTMTRDIFIFAHSLKEEKFRTAHSFLAYHISSFLLLMVCLCGEHIYTTLLLDIPM